MVTSVAFRPRYVLKHLEDEEAETPAEIRHPILRAASRHWDGRPRDRVGLGRTAGYRPRPVRRLHGVRAQVARAGRGQGVALGDLAEAACAIEIDVLGRSVGKQDQYAAAHGGLRAYTFNRDDSVDVRALELPDHVRGAPRRVPPLLHGQGALGLDVLSHQVSRTLAGDEEVARNLARTEQLALRETCQALEGGEPGGSRS